MFNAVRHDVGEFWFFAYQPVAIAFEDYVRFALNRYKPVARDAPPHFLVRVIGYLWTIAWFCWCLPPFMRGLLDAGILGCDFGGWEMLWLGQQSAINLLQG